jgi:hypothetical protein
MNVNYLLTISVWLIIGMTVCLYKPLLTENIHQKFLNPIYLRGVPALSLLSHKALFDHLHQAVLKHFVAVHDTDTAANGKDALASVSQGMRKGENNSSSLLQQLGDAAEIIAALTFLIS